MADSYGELLSDLVDSMAAYEKRPDIFRRNDIKRNHFHNVTNPNRESSSGNPYYCPTEWGVKLTRDSREYAWIKTVAKDCRGLFISPEDIEELDTANAEQALAALAKVVGIARKRK